MNHILRRVMACLLCLCALVTLIPSVSAEETGEAKNLSSTRYVSTTGFKNWGYFFDGKLLQGDTSAAGATITVNYDEGIGHIYFILKKEYGEYTITNNDTQEVKTAGQGNFLHEYVDIEALFGTAPTSITISFENKVRINEFYAYSVGETPKHVQKWEMPKENETDMILFSTHGDDEQLFFAGLLPYYANALDYEVLVVYLTDHRTYTDKRVHEMLNGLWAVGCTTYPVFGTFDDFLKETIEETYQKFRELGTSRDDIVQYCVENLRKYKPQVVVGHDFAGEYSHGQHMVYADCLADALGLAADPAQFPESAESFGTWDTPKAYFHLYDENGIMMDWDTPMEELNGMTPFEVTQKLGYPCHESQQYTWFTKWINGKTEKITKASQIQTYNPREFGLYRTTVGLDVEKKDMFENVYTYAQQAQMEAERLEQERLEQERLEQEATATQPQPTEEKSQLQEWFQSLGGSSDQMVQEELSEAAKAAQARKDKVNGYIFGIGGGLIALLLCYNLWQDRQKKKRRSRRPRPTMNLDEK